MPKLIVFSLFVLILSVVLYYIKFYEPYEEIIIDTKFGKIKGYTGKSRDNRTFTSFRAIPYAKPPIGNLRFEAPLKYGKWEGIFDGTKYMPLCKQYDYFFEVYRGQEDCLILNVYVPKTSNFKEKPLPVLVYFHGGHFMFGGTDLYTPHYFMDEDVVLVTVNYRLNSLGFLNIGDGIQSGNNGLKDQKLSLEWVQEAIADFGGDPKKVTIFGESAGAMSVHFQMMYTKGLFASAIGHSGTSLCPWGFTKDPKSQAIKFAKKLNCTTDDSRKMLDCLKGLTADEIVGAHNGITNIFYDPQEIFGPSIETVTEKNKNSVLIHKSPTKLLEEGGFPKIPWITGVNSGEGLFRSAMISEHPLHLHLMNTNFRGLADRIGLLYRKNGISENDADAIWKYYFGSKTELKNEDINLITNLYGDRYFFGCGSEGAKFHYKNNATTYLYYLDYNGGKSIMANGLKGAKGGILPGALGIFINILKIEIFDLLGWEIPYYGVSHADDIQYFFKFPILEIDKNSKNYEISKELVKTWAYFAKHGKIETFKGVKWDKIDGKNPPKYLYIGNKEIKMIKEPFTAGIEFWKSMNPMPN